MLWKSSVGRPDNISSNAVTRSSHVSDYSTLISPILFNPLETLFIFITHLEARAKTVLPVAHAAKSSCRSNSVSRLLVSHIHTLSPHLSIWSLKRGCKPLYTSLVALKQYLLDKYRHVKISLQFTHTVQSVKREINQHALLIMCISSSINEK